MKKTAWLAVLLAVFVMPALAEDFSVVRLSDHTPLTPVSGIYLLNEEGGYALRGSTQQHRVYVSANAELFLSGVEMDLSGLEPGAAPIRVLSGASAALVLANGSQNVLRASPGAAGVQVEGGLVIRGESGRLQAFGGAVSQSTSAGAGIGGAERKSNGPITIEGGRISAYGGDDAEGIGGGAAGIGAGSSRTLTSMDGEPLVIGSSTANGTAITITGGVIQARGGVGAAGIGGGDWGGKGRNIEISGGDVTARGGAGAAGMGGGFMGSAQDVRISGGRVNAFGGEEASGIGGGFSADGRDIVISGGWVRATAGAQYRYPWHSVSSNGRSPLGDAIGSGAEAVDSTVQLAPENQPMAVRYGQTAAKAKQAEGSPFAQSTELADLLDDAGYAEIRPHAAAAGVPATGDGAQPGVWLAAMILSALGMMAAHFWKRRSSAGGFSFLRKNPS